MSNNLIIHFTKEFDTLTKILESSSLRLLYSKEDFFMKNLKVSSAAHPMVCFSKFDIEKIDNETITYGKYGVGFSIDWANKNKVNPVLYIDQNSMAALGLGNLLRARRNKESSKLPDNLRLPIMQLKCFTKNVRGYNSYFKERDFDFESENEWRYVPDKKAINNKLISMNKSSYLKRPDYYNNRLIPYPLNFKRKDIELVFVKLKQEIEIINENFAIEKSNIKISNWNTIKNKKMANAQSRRLPPE